jgi:hypothetical protein
MARQLPAGRPALVALGNWSSPTEDALLLHKLLHAANERGLVVQAIPGESTGGSYFASARGVKLGVLKPADEEGFAVNNPKGYGRQKLEGSVQADSASDGEPEFASPSGSDPSKGPAYLRHGVLPGEGVLREAAAYLLDRDHHFSRVPPTFLVHARTSTFATAAEYKAAYVARALAEADSSHAARRKDSDDSLLGPGVSDGVSLAARQALADASCAWPPVKECSLQLFVSHSCTAEDYASSLWPTDEVQRLAVLDIRLANADRHPDNILIRAWPEGDEACAKLVAAEEREMAVARGRGGREALDSDSEEEGIALRVLAKGAKDSVARALGLTHHHLVKDWRTRKSRSSKREGDSEEGEGRGEVLPPANLRRPMPSFVRHTLAVLDVLIPEGAMDHCSGAHGLLCAQGPALVGAGAIQAGWGTSFGLEALGGAWEPPRLIATPIAAAPAPLAPPPPLALFSGRHAELRLETSRSPATPIAPWRSAPRTGGGSGTGTPSSTGSGRGSETAMQFLQRARGNTGGSGGTPRSADTSVEPVLGLAVPVLDPIHLPFAPPLSNAWQSRRLGALRAASSSSSASSGGAGDNPLPLPPARLTSSRSAAPLVSPLLTGRAPSPLDGVGIAPVDGNAPSLPSDGVLKPDGGGERGVVDPRALKRAARIELVPIDHGLALPASTALDDVSFAWAHWKQAGAPMAADTRAYIAALDGRADAIMLRQEFGERFRPTCLLTLRLTTALLQDGVAAGLSLAEIGRMMMREGGLGRLESRTVQGGVDEVLMISKPARRGAPHRHAGLQAALSSLPYGKALALSTRELRRAERRQEASRGAPGRSGGVDEAALAIERTLPSALEQAVRRAKQAVKKARKRERVSAGIWSGLPTPVLSAVPSGMLVARAGRSGHASSFDEPPGSSPEFSLGAPAVGPAPPSPLLGGVDPRAPSFGSGDLKPLPWNAGKGKERRIQRKERRSAAATGALPVSPLLMAHPTPLAGTGSGPDDHDEAFHYHDAVVATFRACLPAHFRAVEQQRG